MKITYKQLEDLDACDDQRDLFKSLFGDEVKVTRALVMTHAAKFDWDWAAEKLLPRKKSAEYNRIRAQALAEYKRITDQALAEYYRIRAQALAEYYRITDQALAEYRAKCASIFADCAGLE